MEEPKTTKVCPICGEELPLSEFYKLKTGKYYTYCKNCYRQYRKNRYGKDNTYYQRHKAEVNAKRKERYHADPEYKRKVNEVNTASFKRHYDEYKEKRKEYRKRDDVQEKIRKYHKEYYEKHKDEINYRKRIRNQWL